MCDIILQVMNKLDGQHYAVKKILIKKVSKDDCMKVNHRRFINGAFFYAHIQRYNRLVSFCFALGPQGSQSVI